MALNNSLAPKTEGAKKIEVAYQLGGHEIKLTPSMVKNYMVSGDKERVTMPEVVTFMNLCKFAGLNPWMKEAYCIKYGNEPATMVTGKAAFLKRADEHPQYDGMESGVIALDDDGTVNYCFGAFCLPNTQIVGAWAEVHRRDRKYPVRVEVLFDEYAGRKRDGTLNGQWAKKPATMIRKVAQVQALREAFPNSFTGMYAAEESGFDENISGGIIEQDEVPQESSTQALQQPAYDEVPAQDKKPTRGAQNAQQALFGGI